jgi:hypothetical protein
MWWLLHNFGIVGVATGWTLRVMVDTLALPFVANGKLELPSTGARARTTQSG